MTELQRYGIGALTEREREVLSRYPEAGVGRAIAAAMGINEQTLKNHVTSILRKLGANSMGQAALMFDRHARGHAPTWPDVDRRHGVRERRAGSRDRRSGHDRTSAQ